MSGRLLLIVTLVFLFITSSLYAADKGFGGIGAQVVPTASGEVVVLQVVGNAPASAAGLRPGDLIVKIDGKSLKGLDFKTVTREYLWGFVGDPVQIAWLRPGEAGEKVARLVRVKIDPELLKNPGVRMITPENQ